MSRPRVKQIPRLAAALSANADELLRAAGYSSAATVVTAFDQPFPIDALPPESFERFCGAFVQALYPEAEVHRAGGAGHKQDGIDIEIRFKDKSLFTFQCKRVQEFGPQKVHAAVAKQRPQQRPHRRSLQSPELHRSPRTEIVKKESATSAAARARRRRLARLGLLAALAVRRAPLARA